MKSVQSNGHIAEPESVAMFPDIEEQSRRLREAVNQFPEPKQATTPSHSDNESEERNLLDECVAIPETLFARLPEFYQDQLRLFPTVDEKRVFLCGALPTVASLLPNLMGAHADGLYSPDVFVAVVASAGQGKGTAAKAFDLAARVHEMLQFDSQNAMLAYEARQKSDSSGSEQQPPDKCLIVPANASSIALITALYDNNGRALLAETEIDSLLASDRNAEWGNVSSILRNAFHHETISVKRKGTYRGKTTLSIKRPCLSVFLSGTPHQFKELMQSTENGLFSRFAVYFHNPNMTWRSHRPTAQSRLREEVLAKYAEGLCNNVYLRLSRRKEDFPPVMVELPETAWELIDTTFSELQTRFYEEEQRPDLLSSARRGAIIAFRLSLQFAVMRWIERHSLENFKVLCSEKEVSIEADDYDVATAVQLAQIFTNHAHALSSLLPRHTTAVASNKASVMRFLEALPQEFTADESLQIGEGMQLSRATVFRYIKQLSGNCILPIRHGKYQKLTKNLT